MRTHGWSGAPPVDDAEARRRILDAATVCVDRLGAMEASLSDVATELGITRQTVYRYFASTDQLFVALAEDAADEFIARIVSHMRPFGGPAPAMVEGLAFTIERVPEERYLALLLRSGDAFTRGIISPVAMTFGRDLLRRTHVDWEALGYDAEDLDGLVEMMLRLIQSLAVTPLAPDGQPRTGPQLRSFLGRWLGPAIVASPDHVGQPLHI